MIAKKLLSCTILIIIITGLVSNLLCQYDYNSTQLSKNRNNIENAQDSTNINSTILTNNPTSADTLIQLISTLANVNDKKETDIPKFARSVIKYSDIYNIDKYILVSIAHTESRINKYAKSGIGPSCIGIFQLNEVVHKLDPKLKYDEDYQTNKACEILTYYINIYGNNMQRVLNGYNGQSSPNNPYYNKVMKTYNKLKESN